MKKIVVLVLYMLFLAGCGIRTPDKVTEIDQHFQDILYLSAVGNHSFCFQVEDIQEGYVILWAPLNTNTEQICVSNAGNCTITCDLYLAPDTETPIQSCEIAPEGSGVFENLTSAESYYVGMKPQGDEVDIIIQD